MDKHEIYEHWTNWAQEHGEAVEATTRARSAKSIEISALETAFEKLAMINTRPLKILEVGCGNGINIISIAQKYDHGTFTGIDFVPEMIQNAKSLASSSLVSDRCTFIVGDAMELHKVEDLADDFDAVFTVRCLINLQTDENQQTALCSITERVSPEGFVFLVENSQQSFARQNDLRGELGLASRSAASFNHFIDEVSFLESARVSGLHHIQTLDISSLHDTVLYALLPSVSEGRVDYEHSLVLAAAQLEIANHQSLSSPFGGFGQNRLFIFQKIA